MKYLFLLSLLGLISCGEQLEEQDVAKNVNQIWELKTGDNLDAQEKTRLNDVCEALKKKATFLMGNYVDEDKKITLILNNSKSCGSDDLAQSEVSVGVKSLGSSLYFSGSPHFTEIVTKDSDVLNDFCEASILSDESTKRYIQSGTSVSWYYVLPGSDLKCASIDQAGKDDMICVIRLNGQLIEGRQNQYKIKESEKIRINAFSSGNSKGVVQFRELATGCDENDVYKKQQTNNFL